METDDGRNGEYSPLYLQGIEHFNACDFFEAHEVWEELWTETDGPEKKFFQGLIQAAVALHHFGNGNIRGAKKLNSGCRGYLRPYGPWFMGIDLSRFFADLDACFAEMLASVEEFPKIAVNPDLLPEIHLVPQPAD